MNVRNLLDSGAYPTVLKKHWPIVLITLFAIFPLFADLGGDYLWSDEGDTAVLGSTILKYGVPKAWDGRTFTDADYGTRLNGDLVMVSHPWLQYYAAAASFLLFGETPFAARFPFALAGLLTIPLLYAFVIKVTSDRRAAVSAAIGLLFSVQFLLFSRQCRNYALQMFLVMALLLLFFRLTNWKVVVAFFFCAALVFHCNPSGLAPLAALGLLTFMKPFAAFRRWFWISVPFIAMVTLPWFIFARSGYAVNTSMLSTWKLLLPRLTQFLIECASVTPVIGVIALFIWIWTRQYRREEFRGGLDVKKNWAVGKKVSYAVLNLGERTLIVTVGIILFAYAALVAMAQSRSDMFNYGLRYATPVIPLMMAVIGLLISKASRNSRFLWVTILTVLTVTKVGRITPWTFLDDGRMDFRGDNFSAMHVPRDWQNLIFRTALISFVRELYHENRGSVAHVSEFLKANASPDDIMLTNYEWEPVYFHTRLRQALKIMPHYPIFPVAQKHNLPDYVYKVDQTRWIVCRWFWDGYLDYDLETIARFLVARGARLTKVASFPETTWENRPELHFHRYPGNEYKFSWYAPGDCKDVEIYRVDWPAGAEKGGEAAQ